MKKSYIDRFISEMLFFTLLSIEYKKEKIANIWQICHNDFFLTKEKFF
jgi:hypothetical protein